MQLKPCDRCCEFKPLTYRITSDLISMDVCHECGVTAENLNARDGEVGQMTITLVEPKKRIPFFYCSICDVACLGEAGYRRHFQENHA
jgi:hypothetical protein